ncbi:U-box domain-containing protein 33 [Bienertia sinuspersici]
MKKCDRSVSSTFATENMHNIDGDTTNAIASSVSVDQLNHPNLDPAPTAFGEIIEIMEEDEEVLISSTSASPYNNNKNNNNNNCVSVIGSSGGQKLVPISEGGIETNTTSLFSIDIHNNNPGAGGGSGRLSDDVVYVAVGKSASSMDALEWTLNNIVHPPKTLVYLIHIFSHLKFIPSPLGGGMVPKTQVSPHLVKHYMAQDTRKRRELLTKYVDKCTSHMVETVLIEDDSVANAIVELISVLNIRRLVVGISKSNLRKVKTGKGSATVGDQIRQRAPEECELKIVCQGKQMSMSESKSEIIYNGDQLLHSPSSSASSPNVASRTSLPRFQYDEQQRPTSNNSFSCCFKA